MVVYFFTAIFLKSYIQYKKTGVSPLAFGRMPDSAHDYIGKWFKLILGLVFVYGFFHHFIAAGKIELLDRPAVLAGGIFLTIISLFFTLYAQNAMSESWRIGIDEEVKTRLIISGPYAYTRNPIFLAMLTTLAGLFLIMPTYFMGVLFILSYLLINVQVRLEEEYLARIHGDEYIRYKKRVGRFLPALK